MTSNLRILKLILLSAAIAVSLQACSPDTSTSKIDDAEAAAMQGEYDRAIAICDEMMNSDDTLSMSTRDFFRVATLYAVAADKDIDNAGNMARAARWIKRAHDAQNDSVAFYLQQLPVDEKIALTTAIDVSNAQVGELDELSFTDDPAYADSTVMAPEPDTHNHTH